MSIMAEETKRNVETVRTELGAMINQLETEITAKIDRLERRMDEKFGVVFQTIEAIDRELQPLVINYTKMGAALNQSIIQNGKVFHEFDVRLAAVEHKVDDLQRQVGGLMTHVDGLQKKTDGLQKQVEGLQKQVDSLQKQISKTNEDMNAGFAGINEKLDRLLAR